MQTPPAAIADLTARQTAWLLALAALVAGWSIHSWPHLHTANEAIRLYFVQAVVDTGGVALDPICAMHGSIPVDRSEHGGRILMDKAPGLSLLAIPIYAAMQLLWPAVRRQDFWALGYASTLLLVLLPLCGGLWTLRGWLRAVGTSERLAALTVLLLLLASPLLIYAGLLFGHGLAAALVMMAFFGLAGAADDAPSLRRRGLAGLAAGYAGVVDTPVFLLASLLCLYALSRQRSSRSQTPQAPPSLRTRLQHAAPFIAGVAVGALIQLAYNTLVFGAPLRFAYAFKADANLAAIHATGFLGFSLPQPEALWGLTFGAARGVFYHAPWLLLAAMGLGLAAAGIPYDPAHGAALPTRLRRDARWLLGICATYLCIIAAFVDWKAGDAAGARHLVPLIALLGAGLPLLLPLTRWFRAPASRSLAKAVTAAACLMGVLLHLPTIAGFPYHFEQLKFPVFELAWPTVTVFAAYAPSLGSVVGLPGPWAFALQSMLLAAAFVLWSRGLGDDVEPSDGVKTLDLGRTATFGLFVTVVLLWLAALVAPLGKPLRAVQAARFIATSSLAPGLESRGRLADDPEGLHARKLPTRPKVRRRRPAARSGDPAGSE